MDKDCREIKINLNEIEICVEFINEINFLSNDEIRFVVVFPIQG